MYKLSAIERYDRDVYESLSKSDVRVGIILFLKKHPCKTIYEISEGIGVSYTNTKGAIMGHGRGYKLERSLDSIGSIICENDGITAYYSLSTKGNEIAKLLGESG
jgi:predicted transcriptional regulator with HTH domain